MREYRKVVTEIIYFDKADIVCSSGETDNFGEINKGWFDLGQE
ncbi:MAG: hypothetical protein ACI4RO_02690 [Candidatus Scatosoma sp.]